MTFKSIIHYSTSTSIFLSALSHSFWPGPEVEHKLRRELMESVTDRAAAASWFCTLGPLGSTDKALAASNNLLDETEVFLRWPNMSSRFWRFLVAPASINPHFSSSLKFSEKLAVVEACWSGVPRADVTTSELNTFRAPALVLRLACSCW